MLRAPFISKKKAFVLEWAPWSRRLAISSTRTPMSSQESK